MNKCDCGTELQFEQMLNILDDLGDKVLVCNKYYCPKCEDEYEINEEVDKITEIINAHMNAFENWREGKVAKVWRDKDNILCIKYESGNWWHYKINNYNQLEWF